MIMLTGNPPPTKHAHKIDSTALPVHFATSRKGHKRLTLQCEFRPSKQTPELHTVNFEPNDVRLKVSNTLFLATRCHAPIGFRSHKKNSFEILLTVSYDITFRLSPGAEALHIASHFLSDCPQHPTTMHICPLRFAVVKTLSTQNPEMQRTSHSLSQTFCILQVWARPTFFQPIPVPIPDTPCDRLGLIFALKTISVFLLKSLCVDSFRYKSNAAPKTPFRVHKCLSQVALQNRPDHFLPLLFIKTTACSTT